MTATFDVFEDDQGSFHFQLKAANGEVVADSQAYSSVSDARAGMAAVVRAAAEAQVPVDDGDVVVQTGIHLHFAKRPS